MQTELEKRLSRLRTAFDSSFANEPKVQQRNSEQFVAFTVAGVQYAFKTGDLQGLYKAGEVAPIPSTAGAVLGIAGIRSAVVPVYSMAILLGLDGGRAPGWLALCGADHVVALGFDEVTDYAEAGMEDLFAAQEGGFIDQAVRLHGTLYRIINVQSILKHITARAGEDRKQER